jgi:hypothetical protein
LDNFWRGTLLVDDAGGVETLRTLFLI